MNYQKMEAWTARQMRSDGVVISGALLIIGAAAALTFSFWDNRFNISVDSNYVAFSSSESRTHILDVSLPPGAAIRLEGAETRNWPIGLAKQTPDRSGSPNYRVDGSYRPALITLRRLELEKGGEVAMRAQGDSLEFAVTGPAMIELNFVGPIERTDGGSKPTLGQNESLSLQLTPLPESTLRLVLAPAVGSGSLELVDQQVDKFSFVLPLRPEQISLGRRPIFLSEIVSGELWLRDVDRRIVLGRRAIVWLEDTHRLQIEHLSFGGKGIRVEASGRAYRIGTGTPVVDGVGNDGGRGEHDVTPTLFAYIRSQHDLKLLWGSVIATLGLLWKVRQWAKKFPE